MVPRYRCRVHIISSAVSLMLVYVMLDRSRLSMIEITVLLIRVMMADLVRLLVVVALVSDGSLFSDVSRLRVIVT